MTTEKFLEEISQKVTAHIQTQFRIMNNPVRLGLEPRAGHEFWVGDQHIAVKKLYKSSIEYYGGFSYVDREHVHELGDWVIYCASCERVAGALDLYHDRPPYDRVEEE